MQNPFAIFFYTGIWQPLLGGLILIFLLARFKFIRSLVFTPLLVLPALLAFIIGLLAKVFWNPAHRLATWLYKKLEGTRLARFGNWLIAKRFENSPTPLYRGDRETVATFFWPREEFPYLYQTDIPQDIVRPLYEDGRLIGNVPLPLLADRHMGKAAFRTALIAGLSAAILAAFALLLFTVGSFVLSYWISGPAFDNSTLQLEVWPNHGTGLALPLLWRWTDSVLRTLAVIKTFSIHTAIFLSSWLAFSIGCFLLMTVIVLREWQKEKAKPYEFITKDAFVRWPYRAETRKLVNAAYKQQCALATGYLKNAKTFLLGKASGIFRTRGDLAAPPEGQEVRMDEDALFQHMLIFGGTGEGKTTGIMKPLMRQIMSSKNVGMYICDAKGVLWRDAQDIALKQNRADDVLVIGTGPEQYGVDPLENLTPTQVTTVLRSIMHQMGATENDSFWPDMAATVLRHILTVAESYAKTDAGKKEIEESGIHPYSLWWAYQATLNEDTLLQAIDHITKFGDLLEQKFIQAQTPEERQRFKEMSFDLNSVESNASVHYLGSTWKNLARETKTSIIANITQILDGFSGSPALRERFACGRTENSIHMRAALEGKIVLNALSSIEDGLPARLVSILLKTALYREARIREARFKAMSPPKNPADFPCVIMIDEVQEIATADPTSGLSDATFWNVARSTGLAGIFATQTLAALKQSLGEQAADNFMQQARSKIFLRSEDQDTIEYALWCAGKAERGRVYDEGHRESLEYRKLIDKFDPFAPVDPNETMPLDKNLFFSIAKSVLAPSTTKIGQASNFTAAYRPDLRFIPYGTGPLYYGKDASVNHSKYVSNANAYQASYWRAEDLERQYRTQGNEQCHLLSSSDILNMGRWHAYVHVQRAGAAKQDIISIEHDHS